MIKFYKTSFINNHAYNVSYSRDEDIKIPEIEPSVASEIVDELGDDVFTSPVVLTQGK